MKKLTLLTILALPSCASFNSIITKQPIPATPVQREGGKPFNVATADIIQAETQPQKVYGLYDAKALSEIVVNATK